MSRSESDPDPVVVPVTAVRLTGSAHRAELPLLVLGPEVGVSATALWLACSRGLTDRLDVLACDLPGQGYNQGAVPDPFTSADLARGVLTVVDDVLAQRDQLGGPFAYAGVGRGAEVGRELADLAPARVSVIDVADPRADAEAVAVHVRRAVLGEEPAEGPDPADAFSTALRTQIELALDSGASAGQVEAILLRAARAL